jgi:predicted CxxxxCH...CXXCH cytochrome family protein
MKALSQKKKGLIITLLLLCSGFIASKVFTAGYPHASSYDVECNSCHFTHSGLPGLLPPGMEDPASTIDETPHNNLCRSCHFDGGYASGNYARDTHSSITTSSNKPYEWSVECITCHDTHTYEQAEAYTDTSDYFFEGVNYTVVDATTLRVTGSGWTPDQFKGLVVFPDKQQILDAAANIRRYKIAGNDAENLFIDEPLNLSVAQSGKTLVVTRSKLVRKEIDRDKIIYAPVPGQRPTGTAPIKTVGAAGQFLYADGNGNGICEVCHTSTKHYRNDGSGNPDDDPTGDHINLNSGIAGPGTNCISCHNHDIGFMHQTDGSGSVCSSCHSSNKHPSHLNINIGCSSCHIIGSMHDGNGDILDPSDYTGQGVCETCHNDGRGGDANKLDYKENWNNALYDLACDGCHNGRPNLDALVMSNDGHERLVGEAGIRQYPCYYCHDTTVDPAWNLLADHTNGQKEVVVDEKWDIVDQDPPAIPNYNPDTKVCTNIYCHTDGTIVDPEMRPYPWNGGPQSCNSCHGHNPADNECSNCHAGGESWSGEQLWLSAMPMYENTGPGTSRANSHFRHLFTGFSCDDCHADTVVGGCLTCHADAEGNPVIPSGSMGDVAHVNGTYHVNKQKTIRFKNDATYNSTTKTCSSTICHELGDPPVWGGSVNGSVTCANCHVTTGPDVDDFGGFNGTPARINYEEWITNGHGRQTAYGNYPGSNNPAAGFPANGCWYCHDNNVLHQNNDNPFRLRRHDHFNKRFDKECVYCHMSEDQALPGQLDEAQCMNCHNSGFSLAPQLGTIGADPAVLPDYNNTTRPDHGISPIINGALRCDSTDCHDTNARRHDTYGFRTWSVEEKADVQNQYVMMGVCLKCHDDDSGGECNTCHAAPADDPGTPDIDESRKYSTGFDPQMGGLGFKQPQVAKASSFHFGYKHYLAYDKSITTELASGTVSADAATADELTASASWTVDQWAGKSVRMLDGLNKDEIREISSNTDTVLTLSSPFTDPVKAGDSYRIISPVWKGGKFCWDCHDPHGDRNNNTEYNIYMVQGKVATETDGVYGKPIAEKRRDVVFTRKVNGRDYARKDPPFDGICNVCHEDDLSNPDRARHYNRSSGSTHNASRICTTCHEHRFTDSHAGKQECNTCHLNKPVPRHTAFGQSRDCTKCHDGVIKNRMNIMKQLTQSQSHHVQRADGTVTNKDCYACHWEATEFGLIDLQHHQGYNYQTHDGVSGAAVDLVIWTAEDEPGSGIDAEKTKGSRSEVYDLDGSNPDGPGVPTAATFLASDISYSDPDPAVVLQKERKQVENITPHCLGCHSAKNNTSRPFGEGDEGDCKTPRQYAWDGRSIDERYSQTGTTTWGKYTAFANASRKNLQKAYSAHGKAVDNGGGFDPNAGVDGVITNTRANDQSLDSMGHNVQCYDCHSSHGSFVEGITSSYVSFDGEKHGANLKETQAGYGGYVNNYKATAYPDTSAVNFYNAGAGQCFDCHETENGGDATSGTNRTPWGYKSTFGAAEPIIGYKDNPRFVGSYPGKTQSPAMSGRPAANSTVDLAYRQTRSTMGGHLNASHNLPPGDPLRSSGYDDTSMNTNVYGSIDGLCTPCHDPHGVSPTLGSNQQYGVPLLKGTWLSSPFKEDVPMVDPYGNNVTNFGDGSPQSWGRGGSGPSPYQPENARWNIDRTTFGGTTRISESDTKFAGLCITCHPRSNPDGSGNLEDGTQKNTAFRTIDRIHESVKGWGANTEHSYPCSKCHQPHASGLPRLLQTNCLNFNHKYGRPGGGQPWRADSESGSAHGHSQHRGFPIANSMGNSTSYEASTACHTQAPMNPGVDWMDNQLWNGVSPW